MTPVKTLWHLIEYSLTRGFMSLLLLLPLSLVEGVARVLSWFIFLVWRERRLIAIDNILKSGICETPGDARRIARHSFESFTLMVLETVVARSRITSENWQDFVTIHLSPECEALIRQPGQGLIVASGHIGNWEVAARALSMIKPICIIYRPFNNPMLERYVTGTRSGTNMRLVSRKDAHPMRFIKALADGEVVAIMIDQKVTRGRVKVDFFGRPAWTTRSVAMMHLTTRTPLVVACAIRTGPMRYEVHTAGPVECPRTGDRNEDAQQITQALTHEIESIVRRFPGQYMWGHRRWK